MKIKNNYPLISVIIDTYNNSLNIHNLLNSIYNQTYKNIEIICIDNHSIDNTISLIKEFQSTHEDCNINIETINGTTLTTQSIVKSLMFGIYNGHVTGDIIIPCSGNDLFIKSNALEEYVSCFHRNIKADIIIRDALLIESVKINNESIKTLQLSSDFDLFNFASQNININLHGAAFKKNILPHIHISDFSTLFLSSYYQFWLSLNHSQIIYEPGIIIQYPKYKIYPANNPDTIKSLYLDLCNILIKMPYLFSNKYILLDVINNLSIKYQNILEQIGNENDINFIKTNHQKFDKQINNKTKKSFITSFDQYFITPVYRLIKKLLFIKTIKYYFNNLYNYISMFFQDRYNQWKSKTPYSAIKKAESLLSYFQNDKAEAILTQEITKINNPKKNKKAYELLAIINEQRGEIDKAIEYIHKIPEISTIDYYNLYNLCCILKLKSPLYDNQKLLDAHKQYANCFLKQQKLSNIIKNQNKKIRIGFHWTFWDIDTVLYQMIPILRNIDRSKFTIIGYAVRNSDIPDVLHVFDLFRVLTIQDFDNSIQFAQEVRNDKVDIFIELMGFSIGHRFLAMHQRCAPIQISYLNYTSTSGIPNVDYILADKTSILPNEYKYFTEKVYNIPGCFFCFNYEDTYMPSVNINPPMLKNGYVTFGCFGSNGKINNELIKIWADTMHYVENSKIIIRNNELTSYDNRQYIINQFKLHGINPNRLMIFKGTHRIEVLNYYNKVDISLDTWPYCGGNTIAESLWQGVPVITLYGDRFSSRYGSSLLKASGCDNLIAYNIDEYKSIARSLSNDPEKLKFYRKNLRKMTYEYGLSNTVEFAKKLENVFEDLMKINKLK